MDDLYGDNFYYDRVRASAKEPNKKRRWWEAWKTRDDGEEDEEEEKGAKGGWGSSFTGWKPPRISLHDVKNIVNPYEGKSESLRSYYEQFSAYVSPLIDVSVEEAPGDEWVKDWTRRVVGYVARGDTDKAVARSLLLRALADLTYGSAPNTPKPLRVQRALGSYRDLSREYQEAYADWSKEMAEYSLEYQNAQRENRPCKLADPSRKEPRQPSTVDIQAQGTPALDWPGIQRYLNGMVSMLGERRSLPDLVEEYAAADLIYTQLDEYDSERALKSHEGFLELIKKIEVTGLDIRDIFKKADPRASSELLSRTDIREEIRQGIVREIMAAFLYPRIVPQDGWTPEMKAAIDAMMTHRKDMVSQNSTEGIANVMVQAYQDGLWELIENAEYVESPQYGGGGGNIVCQIDHTDSTLGKGQPNGQGQCSHCQGQGKQGKNQQPCPKCGGRPPGYGRGLERRHLKSDLKIALKEFIQDNESVEFVGNYRSGKPLANRLYKHRLKEDKLFGRQVEKDDKDYNFIVALDVSGSVSYGANDTETYEGSILDQEVTALWAIIKAAVGSRRVTFSTITFDSYPTILGTDMSAEEMLDLLKHKFVFTGGGTSISNAIRECEKLIDETKNNVVLVMTDGEDYGDQVSAAWRDLLRKHYGWAFTFANNPGTFANKQVSVVDTANFGSELKKAFHTILKQMGEPVV